MKQKSRKIKKRQNRSKNMKKKTKNDNKTKNLARLNKTCPLNKKPLKTALKKLHVGKNLNLNAKNLEIATKKTKIKFT